MSDLSPENELLVWLIRACGAAARGPSAVHRCKGAACRAAVHPLPAPAVDGERSGGSERGTSGPAWRPAGQTAGQSPISASGQRDDEVLEASAGNDAAVAAYRRSVQAGNPLSERRLAQMFGRTSRRWARARIADARHRRSQTHRATLVPACADGLRRSAGQVLPGCPPGSSSDHMARQELVRQIECCLVVEGFRAPAGAGLHQGVDEIGGLETRHLGADRYYPRQPQCTVAVIVRQLA
jgi:hypothetical protein